MESPRKQPQSTDAPAKSRIVIALLRKTDAGTAASLNDLAAALDRDRFEVIFLFLGSQSAAPNRLAQTHSVVRLSEGAIPGVRFVSTLIRLARILRTHRVDVLHCHNPKANVYGTLAGMMAGTPAVVVQFHGLRRTRGLRRRLENLLIFRKASRIVAVAEAVRQDIIDSNWRVPREKLSVLENSVDYGRFAGVEVARAEVRAMLGVPEDAVVFGTIGRLTPTKGLPYLLDAFCAVRQRIPSAHLVLLGDGPSRPELEQQIAATPHRDAVHFLGYRPNVEQLLQGMDVFVLASVAEGTPRVVLEAMAASVPCIGTNVGGIPGLLDGGKAGVLVPAHDANRLAEAMVQVATLSAPQRQDVIDRARSYVRQRYSHDVVRAKLASLYEQEYARCERK